jgi:hypothetical protein
MVSYWLEDLLGNRRWSIRCYWGSPQRDKLLVPLIEHGAYSKVLERAEVDS